MKSESDNNSYSANPPENPTVQEVSAEAKSSEAIRRLLAEVQTSDIDTRRVAEGYNRQHNRHNR